MEGPLDPNGHERGHAYRMKVARTVKYLNIDQIYCYLFIIYCFFFKFRIFI